MGWERTASGGSQAREKARRVKHAVVQHEKWLLSNMQRMWLASRDHGERLVWPTKIKTQFSPGQQPLTILPDCGI